MDKQTKTQVTNKWESDLAVIYSIKNLEDESLKELLFFYSLNKEPKFTYHKELTIEQVEKTRPYKVVTFNSWDDIPNDMAMSFFFKS